MTDTENILSIQNVSWQPDKQLILDNVCLSIKKGEFVGLLGPNGSGKSSLLRAIYRYIKPTSGSIYFQQKNIQSISLKQYSKEVAVVLQHSPQQFDLTVNSVVKLGLLPYQTFGQNRVDDVVVENALNQVGMLSKLDQRFDSLSGGEKQRVMIAKAILQQPTLLIMDEPTSHLDVTYQIQIMALAKAMNITIVASFHDLNLAANVCDRLLVLNHGKIVREGIPSDVITESMLTEVYQVNAKVTRHPTTTMPHVTYCYEQTEITYDN